MEGVAKAFDFLKNQHCENREKMPYTLKAEQLEERRENEGKSDKQ